MSPDDTWPEALEINAWTGDGEPVRSPTGPGAKRWSGRRIQLAPSLLLPQPPADPWDYRHPQVGWGLVLPHRDGLDPEAAARAEDAPEAIRRLVRERGDPAPVFRYEPDAPLWSLRRDYPDPGMRPVRFSVVGSKRGTAPDALPRYLLLYGSPEEIPWDVQYRLQAVAYVGRLDLGGEGLERYVAALLDGWPESGAEPRSAVVWTVDHGAKDITRLMRRSVADPLASDVAADGDLALTYLGDGSVDGHAGPASAEALLEALRERKPALIVTTSHGMTGPLNDPEAMADRLGVPVDEDHKTLPLDELLNDALADGAIWYSHACCSAGAASRSAFEGTVEEGSDVDRVLRGVARVGDRVAPLARGLLGAVRPCRAFVGHVEPTFDWTLRQPRTGQLLTTSIRDALYRRLYQFRPLAWALEPCHEHGPQLELFHRQALDRLDRGEDTMDEMLAYRLAAQDRESLVILGDPTVALPTVR